MSLPMQRLRPHEERPADSLDAEPRRVYILARKVLKQNTRIFKQARTLTNAGYEVTVIGIRPRDAAAREERDGYMLLRLRLDPLHVRAPRALRLALRRLERRVRRIPAPVRGLARRARHRRRVARRGVERRLRLAIHRSRRGVARSRHRLRVRAERALARLWRRVRRAVGRLLAPARRAVRRTLHPGVGIGRRSAAIAGPFDDSLGRLARRRRAGGLDAGRAIRRLGHEARRTGWPALLAGAAVSAHVAELGRLSLARRVRRTREAGPELPPVTAAVAYAFNASLVAGGDLLARRRPAATGRPRLAARTASRVAEANASLSDGLGRTLARFAWPLRSWEYYRLAFRLVSDDLPRPVVLQANDLDTLLVGTVLARRLGIPLIYDAQELYTGQHTLPAWYRRLLGVQEAVLVRAADRVIAVNPAIAREMERRYRHSVDSVVLNCPPYEELTRDAAGGRSIRERFGIPPSVPVYLFSGGLTPHRGIENTLLALRDLDEGVLVILGEGVLREPLEQLAADEGVGDRVFFANFVRHDEVPAFICSADVGVIPYENVGLNHYLSSPSKLFHYVMAELPIACSDFPFLRSVVVEHGLGEVFDPADPSSIAAALRAITVDPDRVARYKANLARVKHRYSWEEEQARFLENFRAVDPERWR